MSYRQNLMNQGLTVEDVGFFHWIPGAVIRVWTIPSQGYLNTFP
jgi:hypothetical protein